MALCSEKAGGMEDASWKIGILTYSTKFVDTLDTFTTIQIESDQHDKRIICTFYYLYK